MRRLSYLLLFSFFFFTLLVGFYYRPPVSTVPAPKLITHATAQVSVSPGPSVLGAQTKSTGCVAQNSLPDPDCTPGAVFPGITAEQVCKPGYSASVRDVPDSVKKQVYAEYGITSHFAGEYEVDHMISLELGGSNDLSNLWPEAANPRPGFHEKDAVENFLHRQVCRGLISLDYAQVLITRDWLSVIIK